jgi:hypothetical protein
MLVSSTLSPHQMNFGPGVLAPADPHGQVQLETGKGYFT